MEKIWVKEGVKLTAKEVMSRTGCSRSVAYCRLCDLDTLCEILMPVGPYNKKRFFLLSDGNTYTCREIARIAQISPQLARYRAIKSSDYLFVMSGVVSYQAEHQRRSKKPRKIPKLFDPASILGRPRLTR